MSSPLIADLSTQGQLLVGWVIDPADPNMRFVVEIDRDGEPFIIARAESFIPHLRDEGHGDGCYGFAVALDDRLASARKSRHRYTLRVANDQRVLASVAPVAQAQGDAHSLGGYVTWRGGLRLTGIIRRFRPNEVSGGLQVFEGSNRLDISIVHSPSSDSEQDTAFDVFLPPSLADGALHTVRVIDPHGTELDGSPVWILSDVGGFRGLANRATNNGTLSALDERILDQLDLLVPASLPFDAYASWARSDSNELPIAEDTATVGVVIVGRVAQEATIASLREQTGGVSVRVGVLDTDDAGRFRADAWLHLQQALSRGADLKGVIFVRGGSTLNPKACRLLADAFDTPPEPDHGPPRLVLADHSLFNEEGRTVPVLGPAFDYQRLLSQAHAEGLFALSPDLMGQVQFNDVPSSLYDLLFVAIEQLGPTPADAVAHLPHVLATVPQRPPQLAALLLGEAVRHHLLRTGTAADVQTAAGQTFPIASVRRARPSGTVDIIIPTRDRLDLLEPCLATLFDRTDHDDYRVTIVDNGSVEADTLSFLAELADRGAATILRDDGPFNYSRLNNRAAGQSTADAICFLNNDVEIISRHWLDVMQRHLSRPEVGGVGAKLVWPNRMLQHGGVVLGTGFAASHAYDRYLADEPGYLDGIRIDRECGALTAACMMVRRADFLSVGGFDEHTFPVAFNDVDLSLKLRASGKVLVWTPEAELLHKESASRSKELGRVSDRTRADKELAELRSKWRSALALDPYYNPNLNLDTYTFTGLAVPPRSRALRWNEAPKPYR